MIAEAAGWKVVDGIEEVVHRGIEEVVLWRVWRWTCAHRGGRGARE